MVPDDNDPKNDDDGNSQESKAGRMSNAKAFYRAMYAGAEPDPDEFGIDLGGKSKGGDAASQAAVLHLEGQLKEAEAKATEWENLYKRMQADFENYRKRMDREREEMQGIGMQKALEAILPALDDLDMAQSKLTENTDVKVMLQSFTMICSRFTRCLENVGIKQMQVLGEPFDPRLHEPIQEVHTAQYPEGAVMQQLRPGYMFGERVLRPTLVNVATAPLDGPGYQAPPEALKRLKLPKLPKLPEDSQSPAAAETSEAPAAPEIIVESPAPAAPAAPASENRHHGTETSDVLPVIDIQNTHTEQGSDAEKAGEAQSKEE